MSTGSQSGSGGDKRATRGDHLKFCVTEDWAEVPSTHHVTFTFALPDGRKLRTRLSRKPDSTVYGPSIFAHILRDQLEVNGAAFWACVDDGVLPDRGFGPEAPKETLPSDVVFQLVHRAGLSEQEVAAMTREEAIARVQLFWAEGK